MVRIKRVKVSASKSRLTSIRRPLASNTSKAQLLSALPLRRLRATFTSTSRSHSPCPPASLRRLFSPRCNVLSAKPWLLQNSTCLSPLAPNSVTRRLISWLLRRFRTLTSSLSVVPRVDQNRAGVTRWVRLTDTIRQPCPMALSIAGRGRRTGWTSFTERISLTTWNWRGKS